MATENYADFYDTAKDLLEEFGGPCLLTRLEGGKVVRYKGVGVKLNYTSEAIGINNNVVKAGDCLIICQFGTEPTETTDTVRLGRTEYNIISVSDISPDNETVILYKLQARKARKGE